MPVERLREVLEPPRDPQVRLVGPVRLHRLVVGHAREGKLELQPHPLAPHARQHALADAEHVVHPDEGHLDVDLAELRLAVGPEVLVPQAARHLVVTVEARHHEELLVELRGLRQGVELPVVQAAGDHIVARPLGRPPREERRLHLQEALGVQRRAGAGHRPVANLEVPHHLGAAQVQVPVPEPELLGGQALLGRHRHQDRERVGLRQALQAADVHLDLPGGHVGVEGPLGARLHLSLDADHVLGPEGVRQLERVGLRPVLAERQLHEAAPVPQVHEQQAAQVAPPVHPARQPHRPADPGAVRRRAARVPVGCRFPALARSLHLPSSLPRHFFSFLELLLASTDEARKAAV